MSKITKSRKITYYIGMVIIVIGFISFISLFFSIANSMNNPISLFDNPKPPSFLNAVVGMILIIVGAVIMNIGARGAAGSGVILDPKKAREDLKPFNEAKGKMINDVISNIDVVNKIGKSNGSSSKKEIIKIKCRNCGVLNDEDAKFCKECGKEL